MSSKSKRDEAFEAKERASVAEGERLKQSEQSARADGGGQTAQPAAQPRAKVLTLVQVNLARNVGSPLDTAFADLSSLRTDAGWDIVEVNHPTRGLGFEVRSKAKAGQMMFVPVTNVTHTYYQEREPKP